MFSNEACDDCKRHVSKMQTSRVMFSNLTVGVNRYRVLR